MENRNVGCDLHPAHRTPIATRASTGGQETDWSGWQRWLDGWLAIERQAIAETIAETLNELEAKRDQQVRELELKLARCAGGLDVLRTGKSLRVRGTFNPDLRYEQLDIVALDGSSFVATEDNPQRLREIVPNILAYGRRPLNSALCPMKMTETVAGIGKSSRTAARL